MANQGWCNRSLTKAIAVEKAITREVIRLREEKKLTQTALAKRSQLSRRTINEVESGRKNNTSVRTLMQLAAALEVTPDELLGLRKDDYVEVASAPKKRLPHKKAAPPE